MVPTKSSGCVVINDKDEVLLMLREDFRFWTLPGGGLEPNETWEQAAVRETLEETGYEVMIKQHVGEYWRPQLSHGKGDLRRVFIARTTSEVPSQHDSESIDVRWFPITALPKRLNRFVREHLRDALAFPSSPVSREQRLPVWMAMLVHMALWMRSIRDNISKSKGR
jgi:8-oxo-dGTP diphosphatase